MFAAQAGAGGWVHELQPEAADVRLCRQHAGGAGIRTRTACRQPDPRGAPAPARARARRLGCGDDDSRRAHAAAQPHAAAADQRERRARRVRLREGAVKGELEKFYETVDGLEAAMISHFSADIVLHVLLAL